MNIIVKLIIAIVILVILVTIWQWYFSGSSSTSIITGPIVAENVPVKDLGAAASNIGNSLYSYSVWIYVKDWSYRIGEPKVLFSRKDGNGYVGPELVLGSSENTITALVHSYQGNATPTSPGQTTLTQCQVTQVPIQTWVNIIVVLNQQALDIYVDGKLTRTCVLPGVAAMGGTSQAPGLWVCPPLTNGGQGGFDGYLANFRAFPYPLNPRQAYEIYREGHGGVEVSLFNKYRLKLAFLKGNREMGSLEI